jgi:hypothetical protein
VCGRLDRLAPMPVVGGRSHGLQVRSRVATRARATRDHRTRIRSVDDSHDPGHFSRAGMALSRDRGRRRLHCRVAVSASRCDGSRHRNGSRNEVSRGYRSGEHGVEQVVVDGFVTEWGQGHPIGALYDLTFQRLERPAIDSGAIDPEGFKRLLALMRSPDFWALSHIFYSARGRRPAARPVRRAAP